MGLRTVDIVPPDSAWPSAFTSERARLADIFGPSALVIEHIGSTAISGLPAKPTIDIALGFDDLADFHRHRDLVEALGYEYRPAAADLDHYLAFRDYLRAEPDAARGYADAKQRLAADFYTDRRGYADAKFAIITELLAEAKSQP
jgi:GrpB-like predicted nucleotidyltransferase (UPF0157 family)